MSDEILLAFGSRSGSLFALALFGSGFALLGWTVGRRFHRRRHAVVSGLLIFAFPIVLIYASSLGGFYEARVSRDHVELDYLLWPHATRIPLGEIREIRASPAFRLRWRLEIITYQGKCLRSATWNRPEIEESADAFRKRLSVLRDGQEVKAS